MPQRDASRASRATTGRSAVPATRRTGGSDAVPALADDASASRSRTAGPVGGPGPGTGTRPPSSRPSAASGTTPSGTTPSNTPPTAPPGVRPDPAHPADQRAAARAALAAGSSPSLWWVCTGVLAVLVVTFVVGVTEGALVLAGLLAVSALARAVLRPGPVALSVRSRPMDCAVLTVLAVGVGLLAQLAPTG